MKFIIIIIINLSLSLMLAAQTGGIRIQGATMLHAEGSPKIVIHNGSFYSDASFFDIGKSEIIFKGDAGIEDITIGGTSFLNFYQLTMDKSVGGLKLKAHIYVNNDLTFSGGLIDLNGNNIYLPADGKLENESENSRIITTSGGLVTKTANLNTPQNQNLGNMGATLTSDKDLGLTTISRGHNAQSGAGNQSIYRHFDIQPTNNTELNATLRFQYLEAELNGHEEGELIFYRNQDGGWEDMGIDDLNKDDNWAEVWGIDHFSMWTLASTSSPLPVEWLKFTANATVEKTVDLNWSTAQEGNNDHFIIEKSANATAFFEIGKVLPQEDPSTVNHYHFEDEIPFRGSNYYRIKQVDKDGLYSFSEIRTIHFESNSLDWSIFPNPSSGQIQVSFNLEQAQAIEISLTDLLGRKLKTLQTKLHFPKGVFSSTFDVSEFADGIYFIDGQAGIKHFRQKLILHP